MRYVAVGGFALLPLQWFVIAQAGGTLRLHQVAVLLLTAVLLLRYGLPKVGRGIRGAQGFVIANVYMLVLWVALNVFNGLGLSDPIKQLTFLVTFVAVMAMFFFAVRDNDIDLIDTLRWTVAATVVVLIAAFGYSMLSNGVNPVDVISRTISSGDPNILQKELFRTSFAGFGFDNEEARGNLRHEVFGGLLFTMYVSAWAVARRPFEIARHRTIYRIALGLGALMLLSSLSRSILVAAAIWPALSLVRALLTGRVSTRQQLAVLAGLAGLGGLAVSGFLAVVWTRFTEETNSYNTREELLSLAFQRIQDNFWTGGVDTQRTSSHNFLLDMWQRGGIFVGIPALIIFVYISWVWFRLLIRVRTVPDDLFVLVAAMALPCVRLVTQGGGSLQIVEWVTLAFVLGVLAAARMFLGGGESEPSAQDRVGKDAPALVPASGRPVLPHAPPVAFRAPLTHRAGDRQRSDD